MLSVIVIHTSLVYSKVVFPSDGRPATDQIASQLAQKGMGCHPV